MAEIVAAIGSLLSCFCTQNCVNTQIFEQCKHVINPKKDIQKLIKIKTDLIALMDEVNDKLRTAKINQGVVPRHVVRKWLNDVQCALDETHHIEDKVITTKMCSNCLFPKCHSNLILGQRISELIKEGTALALTGSELLKDTLTSQVETIGLELPPQKLVGETTAQKSRQKVWDCLMDEESRVIGVYGMGGIGKTTMIMDINNQLIAKPGRFDKVFWVTVSKGGDIQGVQVDIAKNVGLVLSKEQGEVERIGRLYEALKGRKRILFILDDMWKVFSLKEIGIPEPTAENGCKLLLTTRSLEVCEMMGCRKAIVKVEPLSKEEAWELFLDRVDVVLNPEVMEIAELVAKECSGLPLAIITIGASMRAKTDIIYWRVALNDLRDFNNRIMDSEDNVFERLKFSYDRLPSEKVKKCLLCCALYPEDYKITTRELVEFWIMDGMFEGRNRRNELLEGQIILEKLKDCCLLKSVDVWDEAYSEMSDGVKMHDLIRDMALRITRKHFMVKAGSLLEVLPKEVAWEEVLERASFMNNMISKVSISPRCQNLSNLFLGGNPFISSITHDFFIHMQCLRVLDLRCDWYNANHHLESLPDSISDLVNLHDLRLSWCTKLKKVPSLTKLVLLRRLELNNTAIEELPEGMEMLGKLSCLNLHVVKLREKIPRGLISKLSQLQELYLGGIEVDKLYDVGSGESFANELLSLKELENLNTTFHCFADYASYVGSSKFNGLKWFFLSVGQLFYHTRCHLGVSQRATVHLYSDEGSSQNAHFFPQNTNRVEINSFNDLTSLNELGWLIKEVLTIFECHNLKNVFSSSRLSQLLQNLEEIWVNRCDELEDLIGEEEEEEDRRNFKKIEVRVDNCSELKKLPQFKGVDQSIQPPASLKEIKGSREWWDSLEWDPAYPQNILQPFFIDLSLQEEEDPTYLEEEDDDEEEEGNVHSGIECDNCQMNPIVGKRYKCKNCWEEWVVSTRGTMGFDLCEDCYNTPWKHSYFVNQHNTKGHTFELIANRGDSPVPVHTVEEQNSA
ncbi:hypothetical protein AQUCO_07100011v1 [Aquilegia coerulea]|uniref:ZZ-type domain-containing protein n=1 Tax=Aquilegia coerulea TaxID=218851 RepID=A0A2G5CAP3_AQUCA|nr:hypothetical protein AQUCO_07100011v1 [Aquilegia coerulea]